MHYCPECGHAVSAEQHDCEACGAALSPDRAAEPRVLLDEGSDRPNTGVIVGLVAMIGVVLLVGIGAAAWLGIGATQQPEASDSQAARMARTRAENQRLASALKLFNTKDHAKAHLAQIEGPYGDAEVSAGWAAESGNSVVITIAWPRLTGAGSAMQYVFDASALASADSATNAVMLQPRAMDRANLDRSATNWNAAVDGRGNIVLEGYVSSCLPASAAPETASGSSVPTLTPSGKAVRLKEPAGAAGSAASSSSAVYAPSRQSAVRHRMMDAARQATGTGSLFIVKSLYVSDGHALGHLEQDDATHTQWLVAWQRRGGTWYCDGQIAFWGTMSAADVESSWGVPRALVTRVLP